MALAGTERRLEDSVILFLSRVLWTRMVFCFVGYSGSFIWRLVRNEGRNVGLSVVVEGGDIEDVEVRDGWKEKRSHTILFCRQLTGISSKNCGLRESLYLWFLQKAASCVSFSKLFHICVPGKPAAKKSTRKNDFSTISACWNHAGTVYMCRMIQAFP